jgi:hypothetical protein
MKLVLDRVLKSPIIMQIWNLNIGTYLKQYLTRKILVTSYGTIINPFWTKWYQRNLEEIKCFNNLSIGDEVHLGSYYGYGTISSIKVNGANPISVHLHKDPDWFRTPVYERPLTTEVLNNPHFRLIKLAND